jgi:hypothetical protein
MEMATVVHIVEMKVATSSMGLLLLFNRTMNVISMVDTCGDTAILTRTGTTQPQSMETVAGVVMNLTDQQDKIILLSMAVTILPMQNCNGLPFMADHLVWMMVCLEWNIHNPTRLADLFSLDYTQTMMSPFHSHDHLAATHCTRAASFLLFITPFHFQHPTQTVGLMFSV